MSEIELTILAGAPSMPLNEQARLADFTAQSGIKIKGRALAWDTGWSELVNMAIYKHGADLSHVGSTWISDLIGMNALRPLRQAEIDSLGGPEAFLPSTWKDNLPAWEGKTWAIPWYADPRVLYYRKDLLNAAGVDETHAFDTIESLFATLECLAAHGLPDPLVLPNQRTRMTLHNIAGFVWKRGGDFITPDGKAILFHLPEAVQGMKEYFGLRGYLSPQARGLTDLQSDAYFYQGKAAVTVSGPWLYNATAAHPDVRRNLGMVAAPGIPFVGGSHLVIWQHSLREKGSAGVHPLSDGR